MQAQIEFRHCSLYTSQATLKLGRAGKGRDEKEQPTYWLLPHSQVHRTYAVHMCVLVSTAYIMTVTAVTKHHCLHSSITPQEEVKKKNKQGNQEEARFR